MGDGEEKEKGEGERLIITVYRDRGN